MTVRIRRSRPSEAQRLTRIAFAAKRYWGYPEQLIQLWRDELTVTPEYVAATDMCSALVGDRLAGFCAWQRRESIWWLEHVWVLPEFMGAESGVH